VFAIVPVEPFTREMGVLAAKIDADMKKVGLVIATADLLIGVTALHYGYSIGTRNVRHFRMIPGLKVLAL
jgi:predicted nucleic acid-binding protein